MTNILFLQKNENYAKFCHEAGIPIKTQCFRFKMTDNAALKPGTKLDVTHFRPGQFVDCTAKTLVKLLNKILFNIFFSVNKYFKN